MTVRNGKACSKLLRDLDRGRFQQIWQVFVIIADKALIDAGKLGNLQEGQLPGRGGFQAFANRGN